MLYLHDDGQIYSGKMGFAPGNAIFFINFERFGINTTAIVTFIHEFEILTDCYFIEFIRIAGVCRTFCVCIFFFVRYAGDATAGYD